MTAITAWRTDEPCPVCATPVQRIVHAENETDYCPRCQTGGRILSDRSLQPIAAVMAFVKSLQAKDVLYGWDVVPGVPPAPGEPPADQSRVGRGTP